VIGTSIPNVVKGVRAVNAPLVSLEKKGCDK